jgi:hypothetical protein
MRWVGWVCASVLVGAGALGGCSADGAGEASTAPASGPPSAASTGGSSPSDVDTTEPGTELGLGDEAVLGWRPAPGLDGVLRLSVDRVRTAPMRDFEGLVATGAVEGARPYYVDVTVANAGESDLGGLGVPLYLRDTSDTLGPPWGFEEPFAPCRSRPLPRTFAPGDSTRTCLVFFARAGAAYDAIAFQPAPDREAITWTGEVTAPRADRGERPSRRPSRRRG